MARAQFFYRILILLLSFACILPAMAQEPDALQQFLDEVAATPAGRAAIEDAIHHRLDALDTAPGTDAAALEQELAAVRARLEAIAEETRALEGERAALEKEAREMEASLEAARQAAAPREVLQRALDLLGPPPSEGNAPAEPAHETPPVAEPTASGTDDPASPAHFLAQIQPIFIAECGKCHGAERQKGGLRLDRAEDIAKGGDGGPIVSHEALETSRLLTAISYEDPDLQMPPKGRLPDDVIARIRAWVLAGARLPVGETAPAAAEPADEPLPKAPRPNRTVQALPTLDRKQSVAFQREILPLLSNKCFPCHGPDAHTRKAGLRLDEAEAATAALRSGAAAIVPGKPEASEMMARILAEEPDWQMPPTDFEKQLTSEEKALLTQWVREGAVYEEHWAFTKPTRPDVPRVAEDWAHNPIDAFVAAKLNEEGLAPAPEADKHTLLRRVTLDLTGLPPSPAELDAFLADERSDAYERVVERLFASPAHAEHMARYWLDAARYADTNGYHIDNQRYMWRWRDWVIKAFAENMPYDEFTIDQLAGDLLPGATPEQKRASGFNRNHMINFEGGIIPEEYRVAYVMDRVDTTSTVWMGLTLKCAQCHDHKFDPLTQKDFYSFYAFFNTIQEAGSDGREGNSAPFMPAPTPAQEARLARAAHYLQDLQALYDAPAEDVDAAQDKWAAREHERLDRVWRPLEPVSYESQGGATLTPDDGGILQLSGESPDTDTYEIIYTAAPGALTALRLDALAQPDAPNGGAGRASNGNFVLTGVALAVADPEAPGDFKRVTIAEAHADHEQPNFPVANVIDMDPKSGWAIGAQGNGVPTAEDRAALFIPEEAITLADGARVRLRLRFESEHPQHTIGRFRVSASLDPAWTPVALGDWFVSGPYEAENGDTAYETAYPPETGVDLDAQSGDGIRQWTRARLSIKDGEINSLSPETGATYLYRTLTAPEKRDITLSLGSNDAIKVWLDGKEVLANQVQRQAEAGQEKLTLTLEAGAHELLLKIVNYGNAAQIYFAKESEKRDAMPLPVIVALSNSGGTRSASQQKALRDYYRRTFSAEYAQLARQAVEWRKQRDAIKAEFPTVMVMGEMAEPRETFILARGQYDAPTEKVSPATPGALPPMPEDMPRNRLGLAEWLVSGGHPLTARVTVNRFWQQLFGDGLVKTSEDFGVQGAWPTHPELLDWLAVEFVESGWDVRHMLRLMVTSATYRQDSRVSEELLERDPENKLLARGPRFRLDAEVIRDQALAVSGLLTGDVGGPSVSPFQPAGLWREVSYGAGFTAQTFQQSEGEDNYRRSMYTFWKRQAPPPNMMLFDAPNRETCTVRRERTNTPLQALALMNDPQFVEAARALGERMMREGGETPNQRIAFAFELATSRAPAETEMAVMRQVFDANLREFEADGKAAEALLGVGNFPRDPSLPIPEAAAYTTVANLILNLDETITKT